MKRSGKPKDGAGAARKKRKQGEDPQTSTDKNLNKMPRKVFMDPIHGSIDLHPLCVKIVDTPEFQRLRFLKQLGGGYFVYPGASHNRFEHSLGVCFLAGKLLRSIQQRQPELKINDIDILCVEIAGLCHDLGHGPFSHLFDKRFIPGIEQENEKKKGKKKTRTTKETGKWKHEKASAAMLNHMVLKDRGTLKEDFYKCGLLGSHIEFIKELITGEKDEKKIAELKKSSKPEDVELLRQIEKLEESLKEKEFLRQIVANKRNGIDVDKWDYFTRDSHMLGLKNSFEYTRSLQFARVIGKGKEQEICTRDKDAEDMYEMYHTRWRLHYKACQHRVTNVIEHMITEAMIKANDYLKFDGKDGEKKMSESIHDMKAYCQLNDNVFFQILYYPLKELKKLKDADKKKLNDAKEILQKVLDRKIYPLVGETHLKDDKIIDKEEIKKMELEIFSRIKQKEDAEITRNDIVILDACFDYGKDCSNPLKDVRYYSKSKPKESFKIMKTDVSYMLPKTFAEQRLRVHSKKSEEDAINRIREAFEKNCTKHDYRIVPKE